MDYSVFVQKALAKDGRNKFECYEGNLDAVPEVMRSFYRFCNPLDVELPHDGTSIRFFPVEELESLREEYSPQNGEFIFASCNGDPIWCHEGKVYTGLHGTKESQWELLEEKVEDFLASLVD